jgi:hypothetical protein
MAASGEGDIDVVNRLLDCKQIDDVNVQTKVSWNIDCKKLHFEFSFPVFRLDVVVKYIVEW